VITHGGNNTTTECMWFGKPMLMLPIFWDQHDNAQRVDECGFGVRLPTYSFEEEQLHSTLERLLDDETLRGRCAAAGERLHSRPGPPTAAALIAQVATGELRARG